jgi:hypothetical protein
MDPQEASVKRWVREEHEAIKAREQAECSHAVSGSYQPPDFEILLCDFCGKIVTMADYNENGDQRVANPRIPLR